MKSLVKNRLLSLGKKDENIPEGQAANQSYIMPKYYKFSAIKIGKGSFYIGQIDKHNSPNGIGRYIQQDGSIFEGQFVDGEQSGWGREIYPGGRYYVGWWKNGDYHGFGKRFEADGRIIEEGSFLESIKQGQMT